MLQGRGDGERRANIVPAGHGSGGDTIAERYVVADQRETAEEIGTMVRTAVGWSGWSVAESPWPSQNRSGTRRSGDADRRNCPLTIDGSDSRSGFSSTIHDATINVKKKQLRLGDHGPMLALGERQRSTGEKRPR